MSVEINSEIIKLTQESLGEFVKKPALTEKLLKKPPFRFLHDIITAIQRTTGFFDGLFTDEELISENVKDRESKINFLNKVIDVVNIVSDSSLSVRSSKIIAGLEPEKTNELLQQLGVALRQNLKTRPAIENVVDNKEARVPKTISNVKNEDQKIKKSLIKKPSIEDKPRKIETKSKTKPPDKKITRDKGKTDNTSDSDKASVKSNKSDLPPKKPKVKEKIPATKTKVTNKNVVKPTVATNNFSHENGDIPLNEGFGKKVELTDILDDSDDLNSIEPVTTNNEKINSPQNFENETGVSERKPSPNEKAEEKFIEEIPMNRPQSRLSNRRSSITRSNDENVSNINNETINGQNKVVNENKIQKEFVQNEKSDPGSGDSNSRSNRISSSKRSAKLKHEPLRATHSISMESKNDIEPLERKVPVAEPQEIRPPRPPSANLRPPSVRPSSARPGAPRLKEKNVDVIVTPMEPAVVGKVHVIVENYENPNDDDEGGVEVMQIATEENVIAGFSDKNSQDSLSKGHGFLVQQIVETQNKLSNEETSKVEIEWEYGTRREREVSHKEIEGIRNGLQLLSRASNPLGKLMDFIQEDVEVMRQELMQWREARMNATSELIQQQSITNEQIQPLESRLKQIETNISEQVELIYTLKSNIHRNSLKILKLIDGDD